PDEGRRLAVRPRRLCDPAPLARKISSQAQCALCWAGVLQRMVPVPRASQARMARGRPQLGPESGLADLLPRRGFRLSGTGTERSAEAAPIFLLGTLALRRVPFQQRARPHLRLSALSLVQNVVRRTRRYEAAQAGGQESRIQQQRVP